MYRLINAVSNRFYVLDTDDFSVDVVSSKDLFECYKLGIPVSGVRWDITENGSYVLNHVVLKGVLPNNLIKLRDTPEVVHAIYELQKQGYNISDVTVKNRNMDKKILSLCNIDYRIFTVCEDRAPGIFHVVGRLGRSLGVTANQKLDIYEIFLDRSATDLFTGFAYMSGTREAHSIVLCYE